MKQLIKLLIIDNNYEESLFLKEMLSGFYELDFDINIEKNIKDAVKFLKLKRPDCILMELSLPDIDGIDAFKVINNFLKKSTPIIVHTKKKSKVIAAKVMMNGGFDCLVKGDVNFDDIYQIVKSSVQLNVEKKITEILLIDDNDGEAYFIKEMINEVKDFKKNLVHVTNINDAITYLKKNSTDVILTDLILPDAVGMETLNKIHETTSKIPIIVLTSIEDEETAVDAINNGAQDYLSKSSFNFELISRVIKYAIERKAQENLLKTATEKLKKLTKDKIQAEQMKAIHALMVTQNHELNQPLTSIIGQSQLMQARLEKNPNLDTDIILKFIEKIERASTRIATIIKELNNLEVVDFDSYANDSESQVLKFGSNTGNK